MKILANLAQGSDEWKEIRKQYFVSSEAAVIMGDSPHMKREELLRLKSTGVEREINEWVEKFVFKRGHEVEALARPIAEARLGDDLYPLTGVAEVDGLHLLSSYDGLTAPAHDDHWEHKQFNKDLFELVKSGGELPSKLYWQLEHQLATRGGESCIFAVSDGTEENYAELRYYSQPERRARLLEGYRIFQQDLANYVPEEIKPAAVGEVIKDLPALVVEIAGEVKSSNLAIYEANAIDFIRNINTDLQTDEDFATAKNVVKFLGEKEKELSVVEKQIIGQAASIDEVTRTIAALQKEMREKRLHLDKLVKSEEQNRKSEISAAVLKEWVAYVTDIDAALPDNAKLPKLIPDFSGSVKGKRTLETYKSAAKDELARMKGEANIWRNHIEQNLEMLNELAADYMFLFRDLQALIVKDKEALEAIAKQRISEHKQAEEARIKAEAERITAEAEKKRQAEAAKAEADRIAAEEKAKADEAKAAAMAVQPAQDADPAECPSSLHEWDALYGDPAPEAAPQPVERMHVRPSYTQKNVRPTDQQIIKAVAASFQVSQLVAIEWLKELDLNGEIEQQAAQG